MRRRPGAGKTVVTALVALGFLPFLVTADAQHEQQYHRKSPHEHAALAGHSKPGIPGTHNHPRIETINYNKNENDIASAKGDKASAVASNPQALAGHNDRAVRAVQPARGSSKPAGLSTPLNARSLQDWEVEDFVLLATVDGSIHARDRKTGAARWQLEVDKPMVETIYHNQNQSELDGYKPEYDFLWIVEPSRDGDIYIYNQAGLGGLQKLHLTVKQLVADMSPYESADPAVVYNGEKRTKLYTVDATTGTINKVFGSGGSLSKEPRCPRPGGLDVLDDEECGTSGTFVLGRTEYTITIQNRDTTEPICTLKYTEWGPNTRDGDLHSQYSTTMDNKYVYPLHDGRIFGWDYTQMQDRQRSFTQKLSSPVVRVFDLARPLDSEDKDPQLVVLPQPIGPVDDQNIQDTMEAKNRIFVNHTEAGGWFAMSESSYPLVTGKAKKAMCYDRGWLEMTSSFPHLSLAQKQEGFVGVHALSDFEARQGSGITISPPPPDSGSGNQSPLNSDEASQYSISIPPLASSTILRGFASWFWDILIVVTFTSVITILLSAYQWRSSLLKNKFEFHDPLGITNRPIASVPSSPVVASSIQGSVREELDTNIGDKAARRAFEDNDNELELTRKRSDTLSEEKKAVLLEPPPIKMRSRAASVDEPRSSPEIEKAVTFQDPSPAVLDEAADLEAPNSPQQGKKKARRGARGGAKHRSKKQRSQSENGSKDEVDQIVTEVIEETKELQTAFPIVPKIVSSNSDPTDVFGPVIQLGHLTVNTETVLGYGGHGTMVYQGKFHGRDVAVKRMLREFYDIASHEVNLLQESDDHPNVIRYYDKEEDSQFFYIALELCPASLQDVIERPSGFPLLITPSLDKPEMLKQITHGIQYLHSLKIVHRDVKPQNILVSAPKVNPANPTVQQQPRLLISDFGLCKKLEADQNSFRATTAHAAGTSGWRAPELLVDDDPMLKPTASAQLTDNSEPLVVDSQTKRSATRAIDIFSLGCIFYYCLTGGSHPFDKDGKFMREANIVKGQYDISALDCLGDYQWEAKDLVSSMLSHNPKERPDAATILTHPFFWPPEKRLDFLCQVSDGFEHEKFTIQDPSGSGDYNLDDSPPLAYLESYAPKIIPPQAHHDFLKILPWDFRDTLGKQRKYKGGSVLDLLRALRNKKNHFEDIPPSVKEKCGPLPEGYLSFWSRRFPSLLLSCWRCVAELEWDERDRFRRFYQG